MTTLATYPTSDDGLPSVGSSLQLGESEPLGAGVKRVTMHELEAGAAGFFDGEEAFGVAVHEARKSLKKVRALLRLIRGELTEKAYRYENNALRETGRMISEVRSASASVDAAFLVRGIYGDLLAVGTFDETIRLLEQRRDIMQLRALEDPTLIETVVRNMERAHNRYSSLPTDPDARKVYGMGIRDSFEAIQPGLLSTYERGRREMVGAYERHFDEGFHFWRRRAKYLRYQMEFLVPLWPEVVWGMTLTLQRLGEVLGEDNDMRELNGLVQRRHDLCRNPRERSLFAALIMQRRSELQLAAEILGRRIYAEAPENLTFRFGEYWESRRMEIKKPLNSLPSY